MLARPVHTVADLRLKNDAEYLKENVLRGRMDRRHALPASSPVWMELERLDRLKSTASPFGSVSHIPDPSAQRPAGESRRILPCMLTAKISMPFALRAFASLRQTVSIVPPSPVCR